MYSKFKYFQLPLSIFLALYPDISVPSGIDLSDKNYIVRYIPLGGGLFMSEIGYPEDEWKIC